MRHLFLVPLVFLTACASPPPPPVEAPVAPTAAATSAPSSPPPEATAPRVLTADTPATTPSGATFVAPAGWTLSVQGAATTIAAPEGGSQIVLVDSHATDADGALAAAWAAYGGTARWPLKVAVDRPDKDGWTSRRTYVYQTSPNEKRYVEVGVRRAADAWTAVIYDMADAVAEKRGAAVALIFERLFPKGYALESFAGKTPNRLDEARIAKLTSWLQMAMEKTDVPGVSMGLVQDGKVVFSGGFGVRELAKKEKPDGDTLYMIASKTPSSGSMYQVMAEDFLGDSRVTFTVDQSSHQYVGAFGRALHFHHGDELRSAGGVGGLAILLGKRQPKWDQVPSADVHHVGHFHHFSASTRTRSASARARSRLSKPRTCSTPSAGRRS